MKDPEYIKKLTSKVLNKWKIDSIRKGSIRKV